MTPEFEFVEQPLVEQLVASGWAHLLGSTADPAATGRSDFRQVLLKDRLRQAIRRINLDDDGNEWLDEARISQAVSALDKVVGASLVEANQTATELLQSGTVVPGPDDADTDRDRTVRYIDWHDPDNNDFVVVNQFRVDEPGGQAHAWVTPDLVLFVNGIPLVVIEAKAPGPAGAIATAIDQLRRYANQRDGDVNEGNQRLFHTNVFVVATTGDVARVGTITSQAPHFLQWKDVAPRSLVDVAAELETTVDDLTDQQVLAAGMLSPRRLLDLVRHFTLFTTNGGRTVKIVARYQQYRAVHAAVDRLVSSQTREQDGEVDRRGGIVWHTQGSGKSLTMVFLVRMMRTDPRLRRFKVVVVTDRIDLEEQLTATADLVGETVQVARSSAHLTQLLSTPGPGLVMATIQKYQHHDADGTIDPGAEFPELNDSPDILILVDEAHRSHGSELHMNLLTALPNAARIGFTGTPIMMGAKKKTHEIFGDYLDTYTLTQSEADGSTVPILYEGRTAKGAVHGASTLDEVFEDLFGELSDEERAELQRRWATQGDIAEAPELIAAKARNMLRHYVSTVMPQRFKGMVVATSRQACMRYLSALDAARDELVADLEHLDPGLLTLVGDDIEDRDADTRLLVRAHDHLDLVRALRFVPVFSGDHNDPPGWAPYSDKGNQRGHIADFKRPLGTGDDESPIALLIVKSMLLTGFDAPVAQVLYLDRLIRQAELLQAIARVNRTADGKGPGLVVDYFGVANHLSEALAVYTDDDVDGTMRSLASEIDQLPGLVRRLRHLFAQHDVDLDDPGAVEDAVELLVDERLRAQFDVDLERFLDTLDTVMPRPAARPFVGHAAKFVEIQAAVRRRYRDQGDGSFDPHLYRAKVRQLVDDHIITLDMSTKIPALNITDAGFQAELDRVTSPRAKASEMEHALRHHIREHHDTDPAKYERISQRLEELLDAMEDRWDQLTLGLQSLASEARGSYELGHGLEDKVHGPFLRVLQRAYEDARGEESDGQHIDDALAALTQQVVQRLQGGIRQVGFLTNPVKQEDLRKDLRRCLVDSDLFAFDTTAQLSADLLELGRHLAPRLQATS